MKYLFSLVLLVVALLVCAPKAHAQVVFGYDFAHHRWYAVEPEYEAYPWYYYGNPYYVPRYRDGHRDGDFGHHHEHEHENHGKDFGGHNGGHHRR